MPASCDRPGDRDVWDRLVAFSCLSCWGVGGMGIVYRACAPESSAQIAIKLLKQELAQLPQAVRAFVREARHMQSLEHPHILQIQEVSYEQGTPYFVAPLFPLGSLSNVPEPRLDEEEILVVAKAVAEALEYAHGRGIIHRDVKPANVLLRDRCHACLADFGLGRTLYNDSMLDPAQLHIVGTPPYVSPGVAAGKEEDTRADIYGFGGDALRTAGGTSSLFGC